jgi:CRISPR-associated protein Csd1
MRSILEKVNYPEGIYNAVLRRIRADRKINYYRAAILKGTLVRNHNQTIPIMLDTENKNQAYLLGRLFATLEKTQGDALGDLNAGLRDKYYSSASTTPASVFPRVLRTYQHHLSKLKGGQKVNRDKLIQDIIAEFDSFPNFLNLKEQGQFAIGYYHQRKDFFTKKETPSDNSDQ